MRASSISLCLLSLCGSVPANATDAPWAPLLDTLVQRIDLAEDVALHKWDNRQPVQDVPREQQVLANVRRAAAALAMDPERAASFFADQIETSKFMQYQWLSEWHLLGSAPDTPRRDLVTEIRPELDLLQDRLLRNLKAFEQNPPHECHRRLALAIAQRATDAPHHLALIRATGNLCTAN